MILPINYKVMFYSQIGSNDSYNGKFWYQIFRGFDNFCISSHGEITDNYLQVREIATKYRIKEKNLIPVGVYHSTEAFNAINEAKKRFLEIIISKRKGEFPAGDELAEIVTGSGYYEK